MEPQSAIRIANCTFVQTMKLSEFSVKISGLKYDFFSLKSFIFFTLGASIFKKCIFQVEGAQGQLHDVDTSHIYQGDLVGKLSLHTYTFFYYANSEKILSYLKRCYKLKLVNTNEYNHIQSNKM